MTDNSNAPELLPCPNPFCPSHKFVDGCKNAAPWVKSFHDTAPDDEWSFIVRCSNCAVNTGYYSATRELAVAAWNTRPAPTPQQAAKVLLAADDMAGPYGGAVGVAWSPGMYAVLRAIAEQENDT